MRAWRIRVEGKNTAVLTRKQSIKRYFWGVILFGITLLYLPISKRKEALHDTLSNTKIILYNK